MIVPEMKIKIHRFVGQSFIIYLQIRDYRFKLRTTITRYDSPRNENI